MSSTRYEQVFVQAFGLEGDIDFDALEYQSIPAWDSVGHMNLIALLEDEFNILIEMDDVVDLGSFQKGIEIVAKYGVNVRE